MNCVLVESCVCKTAVYVNIPQDPSLSTKALQCLLDGRGAWSILAESAEARRHQGSIGFSDVGRAARRFRSYRLRFRVWVVER